jgi:PAS domain S-box-containing protein
MKVAHKLTLIILLGVLLPATIMTYINYNNTAKIISSIMQDNLQISVKQRINYVESYTQHLLKSLVIISQKQQLIEAYKNKNEKELQAVLIPDAKAHSFYDIFLISKDGTINFTLQKESDLDKNLYNEPLKNTKFAKAFKELIETQKEIVTNFSYYEPSKKQAAFFLVPVIEKGKIIAVLAAQEDINIFVELSSDYSGLGKTGEIIFAQKENNKLVFINKLRNTNEEIFSSSVFMGSDKGIPAQKAVDGEFGKGIYSDYRGREVIASWGYINLFKIGMVVKVDTAEAYAQIKHIKFIALSMGLIILLVVLYLIFHIRRVVKSIEEKRLQYEYAIYGAHDGLWDWNLVRNSLYMSPRLKEMIGYKDDELKNTPKSWENLIHPDDYKRRVAFMQMCHKDPELEYKIEYRVRHKNGSWIWILDRAKTVFNGTQAVRMVGFHTDITQEKNLEDELRKTKDTFEQFMCYIPVNIFILQDRKIVYANQSAKAPFGEKSIFGKTAADLYSKDLADKIYAIETRALEEKVYDTVMEIEGPDKELRVKHVIAFSMEESAKGRQGIISLDITQRFKTQKALEEKEELMIAQSRHAAMGEMISMIAHQWRQPISVISMDANNILVDLELESLDEEFLKKDLMDIVEQTRYLSKTIDDFRNFFKPSKVKDEVLVSDVFKESLAVINKSLQNNNIEVVNEFNTQTVVKIFSHELLQVIINILKNAKEALLEYRDDSRAIINRIYEDEDFIIISICDNAGGISDENIAKVFEPYFTTKESKNGTGLGLYISKTIVEKHLKGSIVIANKDDGSCFKIYLPKADVDAE